MSAGGATSTGSSGPPEGRAGGVRSHDTPLVRFEQVSVRYGRGANTVEAVRKVDLTLRAGQTYGLVGESGSGKSTLALALLRALPPGGHIVGGAIRFDGDDLAGWSHERLRRELYRRVAFVPQDPLPSLNPARPVDAQIAEALAPDGPVALRRGAQRGRVLELLESVGMADPVRVARSYPHQLSGGMQQRTLIAMALAREPALLVLDEPTTNLDVTTEATILDLVRDLVRDRGTAALWVSHSLGVVAAVCDRVAVLYAGEVVEEGAVADLYRAPLHPYTQGLFDSVPKIGSNRHQVSLRPIPGRVPRPDERPTGCVFAARCPIVIDACRAAHPPLETAREGPDGRRVRCIRWRGIEAGELDPHQVAPTGHQARLEEAPTALSAERLRKLFPLPRGPVARLRGSPRRAVHAVEDVSFMLQRGRTLGLVGESGSGKSTTARVLVGLEPATSGSVRLDGTVLPPRLRRRSLVAMRALQMVFQSSSEALNPFHTVGATLRRPLRRLRGLGQAEARRRSEALLDAVQLSSSYLDRLPAELSGGEKQRVAIARAFASDPEVLVFDESVSGLDVSVQAAVLNLLSELQAKSASAYLFISHDLAVVSYLADDVAVMYLGSLMEIGPTARVLAPPYHPYTEALLASVPLIDPAPPRRAVRLHGEVPSAIDRPTGCPFHTRCPRFLGEICRTVEPPWRKGADGHEVYCHIPLERLESLQEPAFRFSQEPDAAVPDRPSSSVRPGTEEGEESIDG